MQIAVAADSQSYFSITSSVWQEMLMLFRAVFAATVTMLVRAVMPATGGAIAGNMPDGQNDGQSQGYNYYIINSVHFSASDKDTSNIVNNQSDGVGDGYLDYAHADSAPGRAHFAAGSGKGGNTGDIKQNEY